MINSIAPVDELERAVVARLAGKVEELTPLLERAAHRMYTARWTPPDSDAGASPAPATPILIRLFQSPRAHEEIRYEVNALRDLYRVGFPVPELFAHDEDSQTVGVPYLVREYLPGQPLGQLALADRAQIPYWLDLASALMLRLHGLSWQYNFDWLQPPLSPLDFADRHVKVWARKAEACHATDAMPGFAWLRANLYRARVAKSMTLVHRDLHPDNLLAQGDRITGVLDWGELTIADPAVDVAWSRMVLATEVGPELGDWFADAYTRRNGSVVDTLPFWEVFAACKRLTTMTQLEQSANGLTEDGPYVRPEVRQAVRAFMTARLIEEE